VRIVKADIVGAGHVRAIVAGADGRSIKTIAFRQGDSALGQALLGAGSTRRLWIAGRARVDAWNGSRTAELHVEDAAWAD
jgi:single-stranded-DNA-specific exonuclease